VGVDGNNTKETETMNEETGKSKIESPLLTRPQAAEYLNVSQRTLDEQLALGNIPAVRIGRSVRFRKTSLDYYIDVMESRARKHGKKK
jgi:excisionase family DNA binding protein